MKLRLGNRPLPLLARARIYVCGITPYATTHLGHAATFTWVDTLGRVLTHVGVEAQIVRNVTDVDDELIREAREKNTTWQALATQQTFQFNDDMRKLRVMPPAFEPASRDYVTDVIFLARALLDRGAAYERDGTVYFRGDGMAERSGLTRVQAERIYAERGGRPDDPGKDDLFDAAVWMRSAEGEPSWESPWGPGRPGWHSECAAMASSILGMSVDVHAGGHDLAWPHHAYEQAMVESATGVAPFVRSWMHVGTVKKDGEKIAKSTGNLVFVDDLLQRWPAQALRLHLLDRHWSTDWDFEESQMEGASQRLEELWSAASRPGGSEEAAGRVVQVLLDDLNVPMALDLAAEEGGEAARTVAKILALV